MSDLQPLLDRFAQKFGSLTALGKAIGVSPSRMSRVAQGGSLEVQNLLKLAAVTGEPASKILRAAGKADVADLIEKLYGDDVRRVLSAAEREIVELWDQVPEERREPLLFTMRVYAAAASVARPGADHEGSRGARGARREIGRAKPRGRRRSTDQSD